jgi:hypothetical protein
MSSRRLNGGLITLWLLFSCRVALAVGPAPVAAPVAAPAAPVAPAPTSPAPVAGPSAIYLAPQNPALSGQTDLPIPAAIALPVDAGTHRKFYTLSASLREIYDNNVSTSNSGAKSSLETDLSPSVLVDFPDANGDLSARYTLSLTFYSNSPNSNGSGSSSNNSSGNNQGELQISHELDAQYIRAFSDRFHLNLAEDFRYFTEPSILQSTGTNYQDGAYVTNILNGTFTAQLEPLYGLTMNYSNIIVRYDNSAVAVAQNSIENDAGLNFGYNVLPKVIATFGGIFSNTSYQSSDRGYTGYTLDGGGTWQVLPSLSVFVAGGYSYIVTGQAQGQSQSQTTTAPYGEATLNWTLGERSSLGFTYAHQITPSTQVGANGQESDRFNANFRYSITPRLTANLNGVFTYATYSNSLANSATSGYQESSYEVDTSLSYQYTSNLSFDAGLTASGVSSNSSNNNYGRDEAYVGVRGTY